MESGRAWLHYVTLFQIMMIVPVNPVKMMLIVMMRSIGTDVLVKQDTLMTNVAQVRNTDT